MNKKTKKKKGPTPKRKVMVKCLSCGQSQEYPFFGVCPKCGNQYAVYS